MVFEITVCEIQNSLDPVIVEGGSIEIADNFVYRGSCIAANSELHEEVSHFIRMFSKSLWMLRSVNSQEQAFVNNNKKNCL